MLIKLKNKEVTEIKELTDYNFGNRNRERPNGWRTEDLIYTDPFIFSAFIITSCGGRYSTQYFYSVPFSELDNLKSQFHH